MILQSAIRAPGGVSNMSIEYNIKVFVDEGDREFLDTPDSKLAMEQTIYRKILELRDVHYARLSRVQPHSRGYQGIEKV
jgi:hypothetical protein